MPRMLSDGTSFGCWVSWECGACGERGEVQTDTTDGEVFAWIDHTCEVDD